MTESAAKEDLAKLASDLAFQSTNPYNHSTKERHVREILAGYAVRIEAIHAALTKKAAKRGR